MSNRFGLHNKKVDGVMIKIDIYVGIGLKTSPYEFPSLAFNL